MARFGGFSFAKREVVLNLLEGNHSPVKRFYGQDGFQILFLTGFFFNLLSRNQTLSIRNTINTREKSPVLKLKSFSLAFGAQVFKALGDESRLRILHLLYHMKALTITDLELILDFTQTKTARLMGVMRNAGLVQSTRKDYWVFYRIKDEATGLLADYLQLMEKDPQLVEDLKLGRTLESNRELIANKIAMKQYKPVFHS